MLSSIKLLPATENCKRELRLDPAGKPVLCGRPGVARFVDGLPLCKKHLQEAMASKSLAMDADSQGETPTPPNH